MKAFVFLMALALAVGVGAMFQSVARYEAGGLTSMDRLVGELFGYRDPLTGWQGASAGLSCVRPYWDVDI